MVEGFQDTYGMSTREQERHVQNQGRLYRFGWFTNTDGELHEGVEKKPLTRN